MRNIRVFVLSCFVLCTSAVLPAATGISITQYGITWTFDREYETGQYANGDWWVRGPVKITGISNTYHTHGFKPGKGQDGSMINPPTSSRQGYDSSLGSYDPKLDVSRPRNRPISADNPLILPVNSSLVSSVSWLYASAARTEPGCPRFNGGTRAPRPVNRVAAILTCVATAPAAGSFRPPYCGTDKTARFNVRELRMELLKNLPPPPAAPAVSKLEKRIERPWIDHGYQCFGAMFHPSENMPQYGQRMAITIGTIALMLNVDFSKLPGKPAKKKLLVRFVQLGIDLAGIADNGGSWPSNGGHHMGRKWPILFAGLMLNDPHMKNAGAWKTAFQEDNDTFYVSAKEVEITHSAKWNPDKRTPRLPYETRHIGLPEWGIRHATEPWADNRHWQANYRNINDTAYVGFVLAAMIMNQRKAWAHDALFDYVDRAVTNNENTKKSRHDVYVFGNKFVMQMWKNYRSRSGPSWRADNPHDLYSRGKREEK